MFYVSYKIEVSFMFCLQECCIFSTTPIAPGSVYRPHLSVNPVMVQSGASSSDRHELRNSNISQMFKLMEKIVGTQRCE